MSYKHLDTVKFLFGFVSYHREDKVVPEHFQIFADKANNKAIKSEIQKKAKLGVSLNGHPLKLCFIFLWGVNWCQSDQNSLQSGHTALGLCLHGFWERPKLGVICSMAVFSKVSALLETSNQAI